MPFYIDTEAKQVLELPAGAVSSNRFVVLHATAIACDLRDGQQLTGAQVDALLNDSVTDYQAAPPHPSASRPIPGARYFYDTLRKVVVVESPSVDASTIDRTNLVELPTEKAIEVGLKNGLSFSDAEYYALLGRSASQYRALHNERLYPTVSTSASSGSAAKRANTTAAIVEVASWVFLVVAVILGIAVAAHTTINSNTGEQEHLYVALGISIAVAGVFEALAVIMIAAYIQAKTE